MAAKNNRASNMLVWWLVVALMEIEMTSEVGGQSTTEEANGACPIKLGTALDTARVTPVIEKHQAALLMLLGFGGFAVAIAVGYNMLRKYVFKDMHNLDTAFDAGGRVSLSLTAVTVTSQLLWPADFLQISTLLSKSGMGGALWFSIAIVINILMFPTLSLYLKTRAPGAKTFPQIAHARFGKPAHIVFCALALGANLITTTSLLLAGKAAIEVLTKDTNNEFIMLVLAVLFGSYCMIGGLGTTFYISYFNTALTFISVSAYIIQTTYLTTPEIDKVASREAMFSAMRCVKGPEGNYNNSMITFRTRYGAIYGVVLLFMAMSLSFCDQATWQSRIAAKPTQGVLGFFIAAFLWFAIPTSISFTAAMTYISMSYQIGNGTHLLRSKDIDNGYITPFVLETLLGSDGGYLLMMMVMMALMSTGSGEVMSISSLLVYDIYKTYVNPFKKGMSPTSCLLCGKEKVPDYKLDPNNTDLTCTCLTSIECKACVDDIALRVSGQSRFGFHYSCPDHGMYRHYEDELIRYKNWCMIWIIACIVPFGLLVVETGMDLNWAVYTGQIFASPFLVPIFLTISWSKATGKGVIAGGIAGLVCCTVAMLAVGSTYEHGLSNFFVNTAQDLTLLAALLSGFVSSFVVSIVTSLCTHKIRSDADIDLEWAKTMSIDNPLNPYSALYQDELRALQTEPLTSATMSKIFRKARRMAIMGGSISITLFLVVIPAVALSYEELNFDQFSSWLAVCQVWCLIGTVFVVLFPPIEEGLQIWRKYKLNKQSSCEESKEHDSTFCDADNESLENSNENENILDCTLTRDKYSGEKSKESDSVLDGALTRDKATIDDIATTHM